jgi:hypothetical protein
MPRPPKNRSEPRARANGGRSTAAANPKTLADAQGVGDDSPRVLVDGSNVAHATEGGEAKLENILLVMAKLREERFEPRIVADAALRHQIDDKKAYEQLIEDGTVHQAPAGTDADYFILSFAREMDARILTNDRFRDRAQEFAKERDRIIRYMIVDGAVVLELRARRRGQS